MEEKRIFGEGICWTKLFVIFLIGCLFGNYYEMILNLVRHYLRDGSIFWEVRRGLIYFPLSPVYGLGTVIMTYFLAEKNYKWYQILAYGSLLGGATEYVISYLQEVFTGTTSWNYANKVLDINGRTTFPIMLLWGIICLVFVKVVYPFLCKLIYKIPYEKGMKVTKVLLVIILVDMFISFGAVIRQNLRRENIPAYTPLGEFFDKYYDDERLKKAYPNMKVKVKK